jgi:hypothetical protein
MGNNSSDQGLAVIALTGIFVVASLCLTLTFATGKLEIHIKLPGIEVGTTKSN